MNYLSSLTKVLNHPLNRKQITLTLARILWWKINQLFFHLPAKVMLTKKSALLCYPETSFGSYVVYATLPEYAEIIFLQKILSKNAVFFDVGSHLGEYAIIASEVITTGRIFAFEPTPISAQYLHENLMLNPHAAKVTLLQKAVSNRVGTAYFALEKEAEVNHLSLAPEASESSLKVKTTTISQVCKKSNITHIDLLKIDVEGAELEVLNGAKKMLKKQAIGCILFEYNPRSSWAMQPSNPVFSLLSAYGYTFFLPTDSGKLIPFNTSTLPTQTTNVIALASSYKPLKLRTLLPKKSL